MHILRRLAWRGYRQTTYVIPRAHSKTRKIEHMRTQQRPTRMVPTICTIGCSIYQVSDYVLCPVLYDFEAAWRYGLPRGRPRYIYAGRPKYRSVNTPDENDTPYRDIEILKSYGIDTPSKIRPGGASYRPPQTPHTPTARHNRTQMRHVSYLWIFRNGKDKAADAENNNFGLVAIAYRYPGPLGIS